MNRYQEQVYQQRRKIAESCRERLLTLQAAILNKTHRTVMGLAPYSHDERAADREALVEAQRQLVEALDAVLAIEDDQGVGDEPPAAGPESAHDDPS